MDEYSRIILEHYCTAKKKRKLARLVRLSYDPGADVTDADALYLEKLIDQTEDEEIRSAMQDLDDYLFGAGDPCM